MRTSCLFHFLVSRSLRLVVLGLLLAWAPLRAQPDDGRAAEYRIKAAYLYNFTRFVEWPPTAFVGEAEPFIVAVVDSDGAAVSALAEALRGKTTPGGRPIDVRAADDAATALAQGHIVFVPAGGSFDPASLRAAPGRRGVLVVGERDGFAEAGGTINLVSGGGSVRCEINLAAAERAGLKLSGRLASVSRLVRDATPR